MMEAQLKPYPDYQQCGQRWLGEVPSHWSVLPNRALFHEVKDQNYPDEPLLSVTISRGVIPQDVLLADSSKKDSSNVDKSKYKLVEPGDIAYNKMRAWQGALGVSKYRGIVSPAYVVVRPRQEVDPTYFHYLLRTPAFVREAERWSYGITSDMWSLRYEDFKQIYCVLPPLEEQRQIAGYLDGQTRQTNRLIRAKQGLIALLNEQKQVLVRRAVTRGLDPDVPLKPSCVDWLGEVPAHWDVVPLKRIARLKSGDSITALQFSDSGTYPVYGGNGLRGYAESYTHDGEHVLIGRQGALCGNVNYAHGRFWASEHAVVATLVDGYDLIWFGELVRTMNLNQYSQSAAQPGLSVERIQNVRAPLPPPREQRAIAHYIRQETQGLDAAINRTKEQVRLIREYRARLIADVVTGRLDVRGIAPPDVGSGASGDPLGPMDPESLLEKETLAYADD